ncbi:MAG TPA: gamma-glutamyltransferase [Vicinamibacterales bacterium]|nr:gamma-glutamyltransferase [Vicinamibacterales bacterium]
MPVRKIQALTPGVAGAVVLALALSLSAQPARQTGVQDPAWAPDGGRLAFSFFDQIWISAPDGRAARALRAGATATERDPAWSPDGRLVAFAADAGSGFDLFIATPDGRTVTQLTSGVGDDRWPSWTRDGRLVFSRRAHAFEPWRLFVVSAAGGEASPLFADSGGDVEREPQVSPDGSLVAYISDRDSDDGDVDLWIARMPSPAEGSARARRTRVTRVRGREALPSWSPDGARLAYFAQREGTGSVWVAAIDPLGDTATGRPRPAPPPVLVSRHGGAPAWSPDGRRIAIAELPPAEPAYNGNPLRIDDDPPPAFAAATQAFSLWMVDAPLPVDAGAQAVPAPSPSSSQLTAVFDRVWETLRRLYYSDGASADEWAQLRAKHRPAAERARSEAALEQAVDALIAEQPLIKPQVISSRAVVVSGHPLASRAGLLALERGGNIVDAAIAVSFALGVVEPEASGIGGDGMALLYLKGMSEPVAIDYKDQVPIRATSDNPLLRQNTGDGPAAANIPGVVAGLDHLYRTYGSGQVSWQDLIAPAVEYAEQGFVLDQALPTSILEGRRFFEKYPESKRIYLPGGRVPRPGERFTNPDYGATLRAIAKDGAQTFYRGDIARRIASDMAKHGGLITLDDLAQYRAIERRPLAGRFRGHAVYSSPPPVSTGLQLIETLQILDHYRPPAGATYATSADYFHYAIEAWKVRDQPGRIADPALWTVDLGPHLDPAHAAMLFLRIDPAAASRYRSDPPERPGPPERIGRGTTAFAVADSDGNMIAVTQTLSTWGGTFYVSEGLGFLYNNHLRLGGPAAPGRFLPLARSSTTSAPTLLFRATGEHAAAPGAAGPGDPLLAVAAAGNAWIPASVYDVILNVVDGGMTAQRAIEAPRFLVGRDPADNTVGRIQIEDRIPGTILQDLAARGHRFTKIGRKGEVRYGYAAAVVVDVQRREVQGGAEPRRSHAAVPLR